MALAVSASFSEGISALASSQKTVLPSDAMDLTSGRSKLRSPVSPYVLAQSLPCSNANTIVFPSTSTSSTMGSSNAAFIIVCNSSACHQMY